MVSRDLLSRNLLTPRDVQISGIRGFHYKASNYSKKKKKRNVPPNCLSLIFQGLISLPNRPNFCRCRGDSSARKRCVFVRFCNMTRQVWRRAFGFEFKFGIRTNHICIGGISSTRALNLVTRIIFLDFLRLLRLPPALPSFAVQGCLPFHHEQPISA